MAITIERKLPQLPKVDRIFCCFPLTVGAFMIALGELAVGGGRVALVYTKPNTCAEFEDKYLLYTCLVNVRYFCDELRELGRKFRPPTMIDSFFCFPAETYESLFFLEIFLNAGVVLAALCLLIGCIFGVRILVGQYLYWNAILVFLRIVSYLINIIPLYKTYTEQDFTIMLWGPLCILLGGYCWLASYSYLESIPLPIKQGKK